MGYRWQRMGVADVADGVSVVARILLRIDRSSVISVTSVIKSGANYSSVISVTSVIKSAANHSSVISVTSVIKSAAKIDLLSDRIPVLIRIFNIGVTLQSLYLLYT